MLAMHMANELLTPPVALAFGALAAGVLLLASRRTRARFDPQRVPLMGVMGAFVFAAQMINFPILPGTSGHLGGGVLLAILLGPHAATLVMASILIVQCLIFQDGGLLALGTNILNMGIVPCYLGYAVYRLTGGRAGASAGRLYAAVFVAAVVGMTAGAALVPIETALSGVLVVPLARFMLVMVGLHLLIALVEALITFSVVAYVVRTRPELLGEAAAGLQVSAGGISFRAVAGSFFVTAVLLGSLGSLFASQWPDALDSLTSLHDRPESALVRANPDSTVARTSELQGRTAPLPDYQADGLGERLGTSLSGLLGVIITLGVIWIVGRRLNRAKLRSTPIDRPPQGAAATKT